ncbi:MAG TPA: parallel beta-helix domain-containing protein [Solimonas sp.]|nr:parallel beta-helix domain-containing protein [Solimonas sp.]
MSALTRRSWIGPLSLALSLSLAACSGGSSTGSFNVGGGGNVAVPGEGGTGTGRTYRIKPGANATSEVIAAMVQAAPGDVIEFGCGYYELSTSLQLTDTEDVLIKGCGKDKTVLSFKNNKTPEGILAVNVRGLRVTDLTVLDTAGNGIELRGVDHAVLRRVRTIWSSGGGRESATPITAENAFANNAKLLNVPCTNPATQNPDVPENAGGDTSSPDYTVSDKSGRYGIYPVSSENILVEESESIGASDAGIYVGQTNTAIIRKSRAAFNVFGFEIENVQGGEYDSNVAECNTGGFLIYDLDNLRQYGDRSIMHGNISRMNNTYNFTSGGFVGNVPSGSGMITLSYDRIDIYDNVFQDNNTGGIIHASYELFPEGAGRPNEHRIDWYTEGVHIFRNKFVNNGNALPPPTTADLQNGDTARLLPALVGLKNQAACLNPLNLATCALAAGPGLHATGFRGAHIVWDGLLDTLDADCPYPKDAAGKPVPADARGKPLHNNEHPDPACHYNAYKFATTGDRPRKLPDWWSSCIDADNDFSSDSLKFSNFHGLKGLEPVIALAVSGDPVTGLAALPSTDLANFAASLSLAPHDCPTAYGKNLPALPRVVFPAFQRSGEFDPAPTQAEIDRLCGAAMPAGQVNFAAAARVNCPRLEQYNLFADNSEPRSKPNGRGEPYTLTTKLFSDYTIKYRVAYIPEGKSATYRDAGGGSDLTKANLTLEFPEGTILAKTFAFADQAAGTEIPVETRLLIKRRNASGAVRWVGLPYLWQTVNGKRVATLALGGATLSGSWNTKDIDSGETHTGSTDAYRVPHGNQCLSCHSREDGEPGSAPIGTKVRFMNKAYRPESTFQKDKLKLPDPVVQGQNQIKFWCDQGLIGGNQPGGCPTDFGIDADGNATKLERIPIFNVPGDSGFEPNSDQDIEARARAWLEVNCAHCHNVRGFAANTGFYLDSFRPVDTTYGICKGPTATGSEGSDQRRHDIVPGNALASIVEFRISPKAQTPAAVMPPLARSVVDVEGHELVARWINDVVVADNAKYPGSESCATP